MRQFAVLFLFIAVHLVPASIDVANSPNEIPAEDTEEDFENNTSTGFDDDLDEVYNFDEDIEYEEDRIISLSRYVPPSKVIWADDESQLDVSKKDELERNEDSVPKRLPSKKRKKRNLSCLSGNQPTFNCDPQSKYRTMDGSCNNLEHPEWGMAMGCQQRFLPANYRGKTGSRRSVTGEPLPQPRTLSLNIFKDENKPDKKRTHMSMFLGQMFAHEVVLTPMFASNSGVILSCCDAEFKTDDRCWNIYTEKNDPFYGPNRTCLDCPRSVSCSTCDPKGRKVINLSTSFIDASFVEGSSDSTSRSLRTMDGTGKLRHQNTSQGELLINSTDPANDQCSNPATGDICFQSGDARVNQHLMVTVISTICMREHNRIATKLKEWNPWWDEEKLFQEARRILIAEIQCIVFKEYVPIVLSSYWITKYRLGLSNGPTKYNPKLNPTIWTEFATASFRNPHSTVNTRVSKVPRKVTRGFVELKNLYSLPFGMREGKFGGLVEDTCNTPAQKSDRYSVNDVNDYLYRVPGDKRGSDLSSLDMQRGRDNGLPTYVQMLEYCFKYPPIVNFTQLVQYKLMNQSNVNLLEKYYLAPADIDMEVGQLLENKEEGSIFGPSAACIFAIQLRNLKEGDRFYFEHGNQSGSFTAAQREELKKTTWTQIICKNVDDVQTLPTNCLLFASADNPNVSCSQVEDLDFSLWKEEQN